MSVRWRVVGALVLIGSLLIPVGAAAREEASSKGDVLRSNPDLAKVSSHLLAARQLSESGLSAAEVSAGTPSVTYRDGHPLIEIRFDTLDTETIARVEDAGFSSLSVHPTFGVMVGYADLASLDDLAAIDQVAVIHPEYGYARGIGATTSQADVSINADDARSEFGVDGSGVKVGVLSDSFNVSLGGSVSGSGCATTVTGMTNQLTSDLPSPLTLLDNGSGTDEGAGMAELIADLAPGADILFHTANFSRADFAAGIDELVTCGADVIVDDIIYFAEPMFQDGLVAQAAQRAVDAGVPFFSSAGNQAKYGADEVYVDSDPGTDDLTFGPDLHDFGGGDRFAEVTLDPGEGVRFVLQWDQPYSGSLGAGSAVDLDLVLLRSPDPAGVVAAAGDDFQGCSTGSPLGDPLEILTYTNGSGSTETLYLAVDHYCGSEDVDFRIASFGSGNSITAVGFDPSVFNTAQVYGHAAAEGAVAVGAVYYAEIDSGGSLEGGPEINVEDFSSLGGDIPIYFDESGNAIPGGPVTRAKPEIAAPDGTNTTFFGADSDGDMFPNFFGTSAAAPHAAAVAALMLDLDDGLTPAQVLSAMTMTTVDIESAGYDDLSGHGLIDARDALAAADSLDATAPTWAGGSTLTFSSITATGARASWSGASDDVGVDSYRVFIDGSPVGSTAATFFDITGLTAGVTYVVRVEAVDAVGNESTTGPIASLTTTDTQAPTWPGGSSVSVTDVTGTSATASWSAATDNGMISSYRLYLNGSLEDTTTGTSLALVGLAPGATYTVRVEAVDAVGNESNGGPSKTFTTVNTLPPGGTFSDDNGNIHEASIEAIAAFGITKGCNPPLNDLYCPSGNVTRGQMAAFLVRALGLTDDGGGNDFVDDDGSIFESDIAKLAAAGITRGCNPPTNDRFCPKDPVKRDQMAAFLARALGLSPITPPALAAFGEGIWVVRSEVPAGTYRNSDSSGGCYWARLNGFGGTLDDVITNEFTFVIDIVSIESGDAGIESDGCGTWSNDLSRRTSSPTAAFGGGAFQVGSEIAAGMWRNDDSSGGCYWERVSGWSGSIADIIANEFSTSPQTVTIADIDLGFFSEGCGTWSKIG